MKRLVLTGTGPIGFVYRFNKKARPAELVVPEIDVHASALREQLFVNHDIKCLIFMDFVVFFGLIQSHAQAGPASSMSGDVDANGLGAIGVIEFFNSAGNLLPRCVSYLDHIFLHPCLGARP